MRNNNKKINYKIAVVGIIFVIILVFNSKENKPLEAISQTAVKPFASFFSRAGYWFEKKFSFFSDISETKKENETLFEENLKLKFKLSQLQEIQSENEVLREELDLMKKTDYQAEASLIIGRNLSEDRKIIYLDKGQKNGLKEGASVIVGGGILVGKISKVYLNSSEVELILDKNNRINAEIQEIETKGIVQGEFGTSASINMIPQTAKIEKGQTVITSGLGDVFPRGLLIGHIKEANVTIDQLFQKASLELPVQFNDLRVVWVIK